MGICKLASGNQQQLNDKQVVQVVSVQFVSHLNKSAADAGAAQMATPTRVPVPAAAPAAAPAGSAKTFGWGWPKACKEKVKGTEVLLRRHAATGSARPLPLLCLTPLTLSVPHVPQRYAVALAGPDAGGARR